MLDNGNRAFRDLRDSQQRVAHNQVLAVNSTNLTYVILGDAQISDNIDFMATTIAVNTRCEPIALACNVSAKLDWGLWNTSVFPPFNCSSGFSGPIAYYEAFSPNLTLPVGFSYFEIQFFNDSDLTKPAKLDTYPVNPTYFALAAQISLPAGVGLALPPVYKAQNDTEIIDGGSNSGYGYILKCNNSVFDATYTWVNGSFGEFVSLTPTNTTMAGNLNALQQQPGYVDGRNPQTPLGTVNPEISTMAYLAGFTSDNAQILADKISLTYSEATVAYAAGVFTPRTNEVEQHRSVILATKLPLAPFYMLVTVNLLYMLVSVVIGILALYVCWHSEGVALVKERLNVWGLVAHGFKIPIAEELEEHASRDHDIQAATVDIPVVTVQRSDDEWSFCVTRRK